MKGLQPRCPAAGPPIAPAGERHRAVTRVPTTSPGTSSPPSGWRPSGSRASTSTVSASTPGPRPRVGGCPRRGPRGRGRTGRRGPGAPRRAGCRGCARPRPAAARPPCTLAVADALDDDHRLLVGGGPTGERRRHRNCQCCCRPGLRAHAWSPFGQPARSAFRDCPLGTPARARGPVVTCSADARARTAEGAHTPPAEWPVTIAGRSWQSGGSPVAVRWQAGVGAVSLRQTRRIRSPPRGSLSLSGQVAAPGQQRSCATESNGKDR
jgi:hypothetical protein